MGAKKIKAAENLQFSLFDRIRFGCDILVILFPRWQHSNFALENFVSTCK